MPTGSDLPHFTFTAGGTQSVRTAVDNSENPISSFLSADPKKYLSGANSAAEFKITGVSLPELKSGSGEIIYKENISAVSRDNNQTETFKLILKF